MNCDKSLIAILAGDLYDFKSMRLCSKAGLPCLRLGVLTKAVPGSVTASSWGTVPIE